MTTMFTYEGFTCRGYDDYATVCSSVSASLFYIRRHITLAVAAEHMQDESDEGYTLRQHSLSRIQRQTPPVYAWLDRHGYAYPTEYKL